jgi:outer membrane protein
MRLLLLFAKTGGFLIACILSSGFQSYSQDNNDEIWTLEECIDYALENNLMVKRGELSVRDAEIQAGQSKADLFPSLNMGGGYSNRWGRSIDPTTNLFSTQRIESFGLQASSSLTLYGGSQQRNIIKRNQLNYEASSYDLEEARNNVMLNVTTAFLNVILNIELLENARVQLETTKTQLETTKKQVAAGALPISNELDLVAQVESQEVQVINGENNVRISKLRLMQLLMIPGGTPFEIVIPDIDIENMDPITMNANDVYSEAQKLMPEVLSADLQVKGGEVGVKIARGGLDPRLFLSGDMFTNYSSAANRERFIRDPNGGTSTVEAPIGYFYNPLDLSQTIPVFTKYDQPNGEMVDSYPFSSQFKDNWSYSMGLNLQISIFNGLTFRSNYQRAKIQAEQTRILAQEIRQNLRQSIEIAYTDALAASQTYNASQKQVASLEESFRAAEKSYNLGAMNIYDYQVASNNLFRAKSDLLRAKYNYIFTSKVLDFYLGKPLSLEN